MELNNLTEEDCASYQLISDPPYSVTIKLTTASHSDYQVISNNSGTLEQSILGQIEIIQLGVPFYIHVSSTEKFKLEFLKERNLEVCETQESFNQRDYFRVGEDSSLVILPPEEAVARENDLDQNQVDIPMLLIQNNYISGGNLFSKIDQVLGISADTLKLLTDTYIKGYTKDIELQLFLLKALALSPSGEIMEDTVYVSQTESKYIQQEDGDNKSDDDQLQLILLGTGSIFDRHTLIIQDIEKVDLGERTKNKNDKSQDIQEPNQGNLLK